MFPEIPESNSSVAALCNLRIESEDTFSRTFEYFTDSDYTAPRDITGSTFQFIVINAKTKAVDLTIEMGAELVISDTNKLTLTPTDENKAKLHCGAQYLYKIKETRVDETVLTIQKGQLIVE